jgi:uncharacterized protein YdaU (DUF1376 family)
MSRAPAFQFYAADYLADEHVQLMTLEEEGIYVRLLAYCWREGSIPADTTMLSRLCKNAPPEAVKIVARRFEPDPKDPDRLVHPRLEAERDKQLEWSEKSARGGRASAAKRKGGSRVVQPKPNQRATGSVQPKGNTSFSSSSSFAFSKEGSTNTHTDPAAATQSRVCVSGSKFSEAQNKEYAWAVWRHGGGIDKPDAWAAKNLQTGKFDHFVADYLADPEHFFPAKVMRL